jgi:hypothetical protein
VEFSGSRPATTSFLLSLPRSGFFARPVKLRFRT